MDKNVGASFGLSVLIVVFFAVILYQPDTPPPPLAAVAPLEPVEAHPPVPEPVLKPPVALPDVSSAKLDTSTRPAHLAKVSSRSVAAIEPRGSFTKVRSGETLTDVAIRVYGREDATRTLWLANRDRLDRIDSPVARGSILRTP